MVDERTGVVLHDHERRNISSLTTDASDPRALAYVHQQQDTYSLFYIKTANQAEPVRVDIEEICRFVDEETPEELADAPTQTDSLLPLSDSSAAPAEGPADDEVSSTHTHYPPGPSKQASFSNELMEVFSTPMEEPLTPKQSSCSGEPGAFQHESGFPSRIKESPQPMLSASQILSMFPTQPAGGAPYSSPPYSPSAMPWGQQGFLGNQWAGPAAGPWPTIQSGTPALAPAGLAAPPAGLLPPAGFAAPPAGGQVMTGGGGTPASPTAVGGASTPLNSFHPPAGAAGPRMSESFTLDPNFLL